MGLHQPPDQARQRPGPVPGGRRCGAQRQRRDRRVALRVALAAAHPSLPAAAADQPGACACRQGVRLPHARGGVRRRGGGVARQHAACQQQDCAQRSLSCQPAGPRAAHTHQHLPRPTHAHAHANNSAAASSSRCCSAPTRASRPLCRSQTRRRSPPTHSVIWPWARPSGCTCCCQGSPSSPPASRSARRPDAARAAIISAQHGGR